MSGVLSYEPGDFLIIQLESGYALLRVLDASTDGVEDVWHLAAYDDLFLDPDTAESAIDDPGNLTICRPHVALTNRAFESTQTGRMKNVPLLESELAAYEEWKSSDDRPISDRSIRLLLGLR